MRPRAIGIGVVIAALLLIGGPGQVAARVLRVSASGTSCPRAQFTTIRAAIDAARGGDRILVCPGVYDEQLVADKRLSIRAEPGAILRPSSMVANTTSLHSGEPIAAALAITDKVKVKGLEIDASANGLACGDPILMGVFFRGAAGSLKKSRIQGVRLAGADVGCDSGAAVVVQGGGSATVKVSVISNDISGYQRAGIVVNEPGARATIRDNTVTGLGSTSQVAQNGIQVGYGAFAKIQKNVVQNNVTPVPGSCHFDSGNLVFESNGGAIIGNTFTGNTAGVYISGSKNRVKKNRLNGLTAGIPAGLDGVVIVGDSNVVQRNEINDMSAAGVSVFGSKNRIMRNTIVNTRAANLCEATRSTPGCAEALEICGVAVWVALGSDNKVRKNTLIGNDVDILDEALATTLRQ
jgi:parallel beta-helix repeat protein